MVRLTLSLTAATSTALIDTAADMPSSRWQKFASSASIAAATWSTIGDTSDACVPAVRQMPTTESSASSVTWLWKGTGSTGCVSSASNHSISSSSTLSSLIDTSCDSDTFKSSLLRSPTMSSREVAYSSSGTTVMRGVGRSAALGAGVTASTMPSTAASRERSFGFVATT